LGLILTDNYYDSVRVKLGADEFTLPNSAIDDPMILDVAERYVIRRVPNYDALDAVEQLFLRSAVISYICYLLCPTMAVRRRIEVQTLDTRWRTDRVDWAKQAAAFLDEVNNAIDFIVSGNATAETYDILQIGKTGYVWE
jgi:hypothetical protein